MSTTENIYVPNIAVIDRITDNIQDVKTFYWRFEDPAAQAAFKKFKPGQFAQVSMFGIGEFPLSLPPSPTRVGSENQQDCIADIDFHIRNLRNSASLPWVHPFIRQ
jgi:NAD(P)H-flavin reductase